MTALLDIKRLRVDLRDGAQILDNVSITLAPGQIMGVVGKNERGKSTLLRAILGILPKGGVTTGV